MRDWIPKGSKWKERAMMQLSLAIKGEHEKEDAWCDIPLEISKPSPALTLPVRVKRQQS